MNYGLRWDRIEPWYEKYNQIATFAPGRAVRRFPWRARRHPVSHRSRRPAHAGASGKSGFRAAHRLGLVAQADKDSLLGKILGGPGKTSIRASYGMFYTAIEALTIGISSANAPYGTTYTSPAPPLFATPFITAANGQNVGQYFPVQLAPLNTTAEPSGRESRLVAV